MPDLLTVETKDGETSIYEILPHDLPTLKRKLFILSKMRFKRPEKFSVSGHVIELATVRAMYVEEQTSHVFRFQKLKRK